MFRSNSELVRQDNRFTFLTPFVDGIFKADTPLKYMPSGPSKRHVR